MMNWLLFLSQLPTQPSSLRVNVWRKLKAAGALGLQNGVWMLPDQPEQVEFLNGLLSLVQRHGASGQIFRVSTLGEEVEQDILSRFIAARDEEYAEFLDRSREFQQEVDKESRRQKFTFAELEENEQDFRRLTGWLKKIQQRDFTGGSKSREAAETLANCRRALEVFSTEVYKRQTNEEAP